MPIVHLFNALDFFPINSRRISQFKILGLKHELVNCTAFAWTGPHWFEPAAAAAGLTSDQAGQARPARPALPWLLSRDETGAAVTCDTRRSVMTDLKCTKTQAYGVSLPDISRGRQ